MRGENGDSCLKISCSAAGQQYLGKLVHQGQGKSWVFKLPGILHSHPCHASLGAGGNMPLPKGPLLVSFHTLAPS